MKLQLCELRRKLRTIRHCIRQTRKEQEFLTRHVTALAHWESDLLKGIADETLVSRARKMP